MDKPIILAICGKSCTGKDTLSNYLSAWLCANGITALRTVSCTTRPKRVGEKHGVDYLFLSRGEFEKRIAANEFLEYACFRGWYYGTPLSSVSKSNVSIMIVNPEGLNSLLFYKDKFEIIPIYLQESFEVRIERSCERENKLRLEYFRRAFVDFVNFVGIKKLIKQFDNYIIFPHGSSITIELHEILSYLQSLGIFPERESWTKN